MPKPAQTQESIQRRVNLVFACGTLMLGWLGWISPAAAQFEPGWQVRRWTTSAGLPQNNVEAILQTRDGYLWVGTSDGLGRFDGSRFETFTHNNAPNLASDTIYSLAEDEDGAVWIATEAGLVEWREGHLQSWGVPPGLPSRRLYEIQARPEGGVLWRHRGSIGTFDHGRWSFYKQADGVVDGAVLKLGRTPHGGLFILSNDGLQRREPGDTRFREIISWPPGVEGPWVAMEDASGHLWAGGKGGLFTRRDGTWKPAPPEYGLNGTFVRALFTDHAGRLWVETADGGLQVLASGHFALVQDREQNSHHHIAWYEDRESNLWLGTTGGGLVRLRPNQIKSWGTAEGLPHDEVRSLCAAPDGSVWTGGRLGVARIRHGKVETFPIVAGSPRRNVFNISVDANDTVWMVVEKGRLLRFDGKAFIEVKDPRESRGDITAMHLDRFGRLWMAGDGFLARLEKGSEITRIPMRDLNGRVTCLIGDRKERVWVGVDEVGLKIWETGKVTSLTAADGLCDNHPTSLYEDSQGTIWIGSKSGLNWVDAGGVRRVRTQEGLAESVVTQVLEDDAGRIWLGGLRGIYRLKRAELEAVAGGRLAKVRCVSYGETEGMLSSETNGERPPSGGRTPDGHLWFATMGGAVEIDPARTIEEGLAAQVLIESVRAADETVLENHWVGWDRVGRPGELLQLPPGSGRALAVRYTVPTFIAPERIRFQYMLNPYDTDWQEAGDRRMALYTNLRPGRYSFRVRACNEHGVWSDQATTLDLAVAPRFHERRLVRALAAAALLLIGLAAHRTRVRYVRRIEALERDRALTAERTRIARDLHDDLGANLTGLALKAELARRHQGHPEQLEAHLAGLATTARGLSESMREAIWLASPRHDTLESLAAQLAKQTENVASNVGLRCRFDLPHSLPDLAVPSPNRHQLCLAVKEALHNSVKHAAATELRLGLNVDEHEFSVRVIDNGRGLTDASLSQGGGEGFSNMRERLARLGGRVEWSAAPGGGTCVCFRVPTRALSTPPTPT